MAVQVDPISSTLKAPGTKRFKLKHNGLLSNFGFKFNLRRYIMDNSVRSSHPLFLNQLYSGVDPIALAAEWLSSALNANVHTFEVRLDRSCSPQQFTQFQTTV
jgi:hypothetical protein